MTSVERRMSSPVQEDASWRSDLYGMGSGYQGWDESTLDEEVKACKSKVAEKM